MQISIIDNGDGMAYDELADNYLIIGKNRREGEDESKLARKPIGKKGLGKISAFGVAKETIINTISTGCCKKTDAEKWTLEFLRSLLTCKDTVVEELSTFETLRAKIISYNNINLSKSANEIYKRVLSNFSRIVGKKFLDEILPDFGKESLWFL